jgi:hypothetical protein
MAKVNKKVVAKKAETKPVAQAAAPAPAPTPKATATAKPAATPAASINRGRTTGMRVMQFQDQLLADNMKAKLTDAQLLEAMRKEFPNAKGKIFTADQETRLGIMRVVRRLFNEGRHGSQTIQAPKGGVPQFDAKGEVVEEKPRARRGAKVDETLAKAS